MNVYYNEYDANAAQWLKNLIAAGEIPDGEVDTRSILEVKASEVSGYRQQHYFAGIGGWPLALNLARWGGRPVITGSPPCQPFSTEGKGCGHEDERHLWPALFRLIREQSIGVCFGEQVAAAIGQGWLDGVFSDLEGEDFACAAAVLGAHSVGAPHIRQRLYLVADRASLGRRGGRDGDSPRDEGEVQVTGLRAIGGLQHSESDGWLEWGAEPGGRGAERGCGAGGFGDGEGERRDGRQSSPESSGRGSPQDSGPWSDYRIIPCTDGKARRTGARVFPLVARFSRGMGPSEPGFRSMERRASRNRVSRLRGYGNAIVPALAAEFVRAYMEATR